ncbi:MAG: hypothetical protein HKN10_11785 [Myxococcales bacterium]|nr:hypothetical protein [Myxococcales bacterium]
MHKYAWLVLSMGLVFSVVGCGDESGSNGSGSGGSAGSGGSGGTAGGGGSGTTATVTGTVSVEALAGSSNVEGATVGVLGTTTTATSDMNGDFSLESPVGTVLFLTTAPNTWGELLADDVPAAGLAGLDPQVLADDVVAEVASEIGQAIDPAKGIVVVEFGGEVATGGETADLGVTYGVALVFDADENAVLGNTLIAGGDTVIVFANVDIVADVMPTATGCSLEFPAAVYPAQAKTITAVDVACP